tara:strand:+ start:838 stop:1392 length:555 start_codon:yes stop_codon:yes gene_type:complete
MSKLLNEATMRRFMKYANINDTLAESFIDRISEDEAVEETEEVAEGVEELEEEELEEDLDLEEALDSLEEDEEVVEEETLDEEEVDLAEEEEDDMPEEEEMADEGSMSEVTVPEDIAQAIIELAEMLKDAMGAPKDDMDMEPEPDMDMDMDMGDDEPVAEQQVAESVVDRIAANVAKRLKEKSK